MKMKVQEIAPRLLSRKELARYLGVGLSTLKYVKVREIRLGDRRIAYDIRDVDAWIDKIKEEGAEK